MKNNSDRHEPIKTTELQATIFGECVRVKHVCKRLTLP